MNISFAEIGDEAISSIVSQIDTKGFAVLPNFVESEDLVRARAFVAEALHASNGDYRGFVGPDEVSGSGLDVLARSQRLRTMMERIYERGTGRSPPPQEFYQLLRCLTGPSAEVHSNRYHYDSYVITMLIPIEIPTGGQTGDLLLIPNARSIRSQYWINVVDKILLDNAITQFALRKLTNVGLIKVTRLKLVPGHAYFFWGYRTIHTNEPCDPDRVRATALFHYANPHVGAAVPLRKFRAPSASDSMAHSH
jgi:hypothetical protein